VRRLNELEVRKEYQIEITNRFAALESLSDDDITSASENIKEKIRSSAKHSLRLQELKEHKPWFGEECLGCLGQGKHAKMQWIQDPRKNKVDDLNSVRCEASRHCRNKKK